MTQQVTPSHIYHSELLRAKQTAQVFIDGFNIEANKVHTLPLLNEFHCLGYSKVADMVGAERAVLAKEYWSTADIDYQDSSDSDSFADFLWRVDDFIQSLDDANNVEDFGYPDNSLFFGHGIWIGLLAWRLLGCPINSNADMQKFRNFQTALPMYNTVVYRLTISELSPYNHGISNHGIKQLQWFELL